MDTNTNDPTAGVVPENCLTKPSAHKLNFVQMLLMEIISHHTKLPLLPFILDYPATHDYVCHSQASMGELSSVDSNSPQSIKEEC